MKIVYNRFIPFGRYYCINLFGILFVRGDRKISLRTYNHEKIHLKQMQELLWIGFYLWYAIEYVIIFLCRVCSTKQKDRYHEVSFEEEAYKHENDNDYLEHRRHFAWLDYLSIHSNDK